MKIKRILCALVAVMMLATSTFAATSNVIKIDGVAAGSDITINVIYPDGYSDLGTVYVIPEAALTAASEGDLSSAVFVGESDTVSSNVTYTFRMPAGAADGVYAVVIDGGNVGLESNTKKFMFNKSAEAVSDAIDALASASDPVAALNAGVASNVWYIDQTANSDEVAALTKSLAEDATEGTDVEDAFAAAVALTGNASDDELADLVENYDDVLGVDTSDDAYIEHEEKVIETFGNLLDEETPATKEDVQEKFNEACALTALNEASEEDVIDVIEEYGTTLGVDLTGKYLVADKALLAEKLADATFNDTDDVISKFNSVLDELVPDSIPAPGGGSGGGGGGGGGGNTTPSIVGTPEAEEVISGITDSEASFNDISGHWAEDIVEYVFESHIMNGYPDDSFRPDDAITREEWAKVVLNAFGFQIVDGDCDLVDVNRNEWYYPYVSTAYELGIVKGISADAFGTGQAVTRQDAMVMINRAYSMLYNISTSHLATVITAEAKAAVSFEDMEQVADYAEDAIRTFAVIEVINGYEDGTLKPNGKITRAESAKIIKALLDAVDR